MSYEFDPNHQPSEDYQPNTESTTPQRPNGYDPDYYRNRPSRPSEKGKGLATASLILGIVSLVMIFTCCLAYFSIIPAIAGIICGVLSKNNEEKKSSYAIAGIICSVVATVLFILILAITIFFIGNSSDYINGRTFSLTNPFEYTLPSENSSDTL